MAYRTHRCNNVAVPWWYQKIPPSLIGPFFVFYFVLPFLFAPKKRSQYWLGFPIRCETPPYMKVDPMIRSYLFKGFFNLFAKIYHEKSSFVCLFTKHVSLYFPFTSNGNRAKRSIFFFHYKQSIIHTNLVIFSTNLVCTDVDATTRCLWRCVRQSCCEITCCTQTTEKDLQ